MLGVRISHLVDLQHLGPCDFVGIQQFSIVYLGCTTECVGSTRDAPPGVGTVAALKSERTATLQDGVYGIDSDAPPGEKPNQILICNTLDFAISWAISWAIYGLNSTHFSGE